MLQLKQLAVLVTWLIVPCTAGVYVDNGNPYKDGPLNITNLTLSVSADGPPIYTTVFYPKIPGHYAVVYFVPGAPDGFIPALWYTDLMTRIASHGFIVLAVDAFWPLMTANLEFGADNLIARHISNIAWLQANLTTHISSEMSVKAEWLSSSLLCHSAGCDVTLQMLQFNASLVNATVFMEPFSVNIKKAFETNKLPAYMYGTQFSEQLGPFPCSIPGVDYLAFYNAWNGSRWLTEVADFGHCDVLDKFPWTTCHIGHFCKTVGDWSRVYPAYHVFAQGAVSAFLIGTTQGHMDTLKYIEDRTIIPEKLLLVNHTVIPHELKIRT